MGGLAFEWLVEARDGGSCVVRLVNSGFGDGEEWDDQYDSMLEGWRLFLFNLQLHCRHFLGRDAESMLPMGGTSLPRGEAWARVCGDLGIPEQPTIGDRVVAKAGDDLSLAGTIVKTSPSAIALLLDTPTTGTAFIAVEGGEQAGISVWSYLYGPDARAIVERDRPLWQEWLAGFAAR